MRSRLGLGADEVFQCLADAQMLAPRFRPVRNNCSTCGANTAESSRDQHSSRTVMFGCPLRPTPRSDIAFAMIMLIELSSFGSEVKPFYIEEEPVLVCADRLSAGRITWAYTFSPVHSRSFTAANCASSRIRSTSDSSRHVSSS